MSSSPGETESSFLPDPSEEFEVATLAAAYDLLPDPVMLFRARDLTLIHANPPALHLCESSPEEIRGASLSDLLPWKDPDSIRTILEALEAERSLAEARVRFTTGAGEDRFLELSSRFCRAGDTRCVLLRARDATKQVLARGQTRESQERLTALLQGVQDIVFRHDAQGNYLDVHAPDPSMLAVPPRDLLGANYHDVGLPPELVKEVDQAMVVAREEGRTQTIRYDLPLGGGLHHWEMQLTPIQEGEFYAIVRNIDDRVRAQESLRESEEFFRTSFQASPLAVAVMSSQGAFLRVNEQLVRLLGYSEEELRGTTWDDVTHPDDIGKGKDLVTELVSGRQTTGQIEKRYVTKGGRVVWAELTTALARDAQGEPAYFISHIQDITLRKRAQEELLKAKALYEMAMNAGQVMVHEHDLEEEEIRMDPLFFEILGLPAAEVVSFEDWKDLVHPEDLSEVMARGAERLVEEGPDSGVAYRMLHADGSIRWFLSRTEVKRKEGGVPRALVGATVDITEEKKAEEELRETRKRYRLAAAAGGIGIFEWFPGDLEVVLDSRLSSLLGFPGDRKRIPAGDLLDLMAPEDRIRIQERIAAGPMEPGEIGTAELSIRTAKKGFRRLHLSYTLAEAEANDPSRMVGAVRDITERHRMEVRLREEQDRLQKTLEAVSEGTFDFHPQEGRLEMNERALGLFGLPVDEPVRTFDNVVPHVHPEDQEDLRRSLESHLSGEVPSFSCEFRVVPVEASREEGVHWLLSRGRVVERDQGGRPLRMVGTCVDVTERKRSEVALADAGERYRTMFTENRSVMFTVDPDSGRIVDANSAAQEFYGYDRDILQNMNITDLNVLPPEEVHRRMTQARERHRNHFRFRHRLANGEVRDVEVFSGPMRLHHGTLLYSIVHDVTDRVRAEQALERALERYRILFQGVSDAVIIHRPDGRIVEVNDVACKQLGYARSELVGREPPSVLGPEDAEKYEERARRLLEDGGRRIFESSHVRQDGTIMPVEVVAQPLDVGGEQLIVSVVRDLTHRKREQEQRVRAERLEATATLTAGFAHDINNLMAGILGNAGLVEEDLNQGREPDREPLQAILEAAKEAGELAHQLLTYAGGGSFLPKQLRVNGVVRKALETMASSVGPDVVVEVDLGAEDDQLFADQGQVEMIVGNLLKNALEAVGDSGRILVRSENLREERAGSSEDAPVVAEWFRLTFQDDGEGMDTFTMDHMFEPFFSSRFTGRGMGLAAVHGAVRHLQGRIGVESDPGAGTTIRIEIPL